MIVYRGSHQHFQVIPRIRYTNRGFDRALMYVLFTIESNYDRQCTLYFDDQGPPEMRTILRQGNPFTMRVPTTRRGDSSTVGSNLLNSDTEDGGKRFRRYFSISSIPPSSLTQWEGPRVRSPRDWGWTRHRVVRGHSPDTCRTTERGRVGRNVEEVLGRYTSTKPSFCPGTQRDWTDKETGFITMARGPEVRISLESPTLLCHVESPSVVLETLEPRCTVGSCKHIESSHLLLFLLI